MNDSERSLNLVNPWSGEIVTVHPEDLEHRDWEAMAILMDDEIREFIHNYLAPCSNWEFWVAYTNRVGVEGASLIWFS